MEKIAEATDTTKMYKQIETVNAWGSETQSMLGNGLKVQSTYHATTGLPDRVLVTNPLTQTIQDNTYAYNDIGILTNRSRFVKSNGSTLSETFHYDELNRLTQATATGLPTQSFQYDIKGNITYKSDVGNYTYGAGNAGPHAVTTAASDNYTYDATGNMLTGGGRTVTYNTFRKPLTLSKGTHTSTFTYGPDRSHYKRVDADGTTVKTTLSIGNVEFITYSSGVTETKRYIGDIAVVTTTSSGSPSTQYLHKDTLGSTDIITDAVGGIVAEMSFDAFGKRRNVLTLAELAEAQYDVLNAITTKGFTGHEMVDEVGIIHMGGRIYDPELGRFMSADPIISDVSNVQRLNRYSYVLNNPLSLVDPSGFDGELPFPEPEVDGIIDVYGQRPPEDGLSGPALDDMTYAALSDGRNGFLSDMVGEKFVQEAADREAYMQLQAEQLAPALIQSFLTAVQAIATFTKNLVCGDSGSTCDNSIADKVIIAVIGAVGKNQDTADAERGTISDGGLLSGTASESEEEHHHNNVKASDESNSGPEDVRDIFADEDWGDKWTVRIGVKTHNFGGADNVEFREKTPCSPCRQLVYNDDGYRDYSDTNKGTLDTVSPDESPLGHFTNDVAPWIMFGNGPNDGTTPSERLGAALLTPFTSRKIEGEEVYRQFNFDGGFI